MEYIGHGGARVVFRDGDRVLKIPYSRCGLAENRVEAERYALNKDGLFAPCFLLDNGWLRMDLLPEDLTFDYACFLCGSRCELYDDAERMIVERDITCDLNCEDCERNVVRDFSDISEEIQAVVCDGLRAQLGKDPEGNIRLYDYGTTDKSDYLARDGFYFNTAYLPLFLSFVEAGNPEDFSSWAIANRRTMPKREPRTGDSLREYNRRVRMRMKEEQQA